MDIGEPFGYVASLLVFAAFYTKSMVPLRIAAIASNVAFIVYGWIDGLAPILVLHSALLPLNVLRLVELRRIAVGVETASNDEASIEVLFPLMTRMTIRAAEMILEADNEADRLYYIVEGYLFVPEVQKELGPGCFLGEFSQSPERGGRTTAAVARTDCVAMVLTRKAALAAFVQHPQLAPHLLRFVSRAGMYNAELCRLGRPPAHDRAA
jgi:CRP/FNR family transcriptional regulator, cyclic AMP receptor protein